MMTKFRDMSMEDFASVLSSDSPTPGGGSASAIALSQAGSLSCMVANLTIGRERYIDGWEVAQTALELGSKAIEKGFFLADADADGYDNVMEAYRMPKTNDVEKSERKVAIENASIDASKPPMEIATISLELMRILPKLASNGNQNAITDVGVSSLLASAACKGALFNAEINLVGMDNDFARETRDKASEMRDECSKLAKEVMLLVHHSLSG
jgi:formiminotetrahydrofolate cyclodeaminase